MLQNIQKAFENKQVVWRQHALTRMLERDISRQDVFFVIQSGKIIESYSDSNPYPGCLISGQFNQKKLHIVVSWDEEVQFAYVITAYVPDLDHFEKNGETRKRGV